MDNNILKVNSIRATEEVYDKFKQISQQEFENQGQALASLIQLYEIEKGKSTIVERKVEIENYQAHINAIGEMFITSLQLNQDAELRIRSEFEALLLSKDKTIIEKQSKVEDLNESLKDIKIKCELFKEDNTKINRENIDLKKEIDSKEKEYNKTVLDKDKLITALEDKVSESSKSIVALVKEKETYTQKLEDFDAIQKERDLYKKEIDNLSAALEQIKIKHTEDISKISTSSAIEIEKALLLQEKQNQKELSELQKQAYAQSKTHDQTILEKEKELLLLDKSHQDNLAEVRQQSYEKLQTYTDKIENLRNLKSELEHTISEQEKKISLQENELSKLFSPESKI